MQFHLVVSLSLLYNIFIVLFVFELPESQEDGE
jgi:hypothetical protein